MCRLSSYAITDIGMIRENNEDNYYINGYYKQTGDIKSETYADDQQREQYLFAVCDGMGGEEFGEIAAMTAVKNLIDYQDTNFVNTANEYFKRANQLVCAEIEKNEGKRIGTTAALLYIKNGKAMSYNIGDSRVYLYRKNKLIQLSEDHTQAQSLVKMKLLKQSEVANHKDKHKLTQHLGIFADELIIQPYVSDYVSLRQGDIFLLCSDGLTDMVSDEGIAKILSQPLESSKDFVTALVEIAIESGGKDNITAIVVQIVEQQGFWNKLF